MLTTRAQLAALSLTGTLLISCSERPDGSVDTLFSRASALSDQAFEQSFEGDEERVTDLLFQAIALYSEILDSPNLSRRQTGDAYLLRGNARLSVNELERALNDFLMAVEVDPGNPDYLFRRAYLHAVLGMNTEVIDDLDQVLAIDPAYEGATGDRGLLLLQLKRYEEAIVDLSSAIDGDTRNSRSLFEMRGDANLGLGEHDAALQDYQEALRVSQDSRHDLFRPNADAIGYDPFELDIRMKIASIFELKGAPERAAEQYSAILAIEPRFQEAHDALARLREGA